MRAMMKDWSWWSWGWRLALLCMSLAVAARQARRRDWPAVVEWLLAASMWLVISFVRPAEAWQGVTLGVLIGFHLGKLHEAWVGSRKAAARGPR